MAGENVGKSSGLSSTCVDAGSASTVAVDSADGAEAPPGPGSGPGTGSDGVVEVGGVGAGVVGVGVLGCVGVGVFVGLSVCARIRFSAAASAFIAAPRQAAGFFDFPQVRIAASYALPAATSALRAAAGDSRRGAAACD